MFVEHLSLADYRSYPLVELPLRSGVTVFVGANGQGKTNLVEAIEYLSTMSSHRVASEVPLVRAGQPRALVRARVRAGREDERTLTLEIEITPGKSNRARLNRSPLKRPRELVGILRTVVFSPEDLAIVKGDPSERRHFVDALVVNRWPRMAGVRGDYDRILKQRNTLLKSLAGKGTRMAGAAETLDTWSAQLAQVGAELLEARLDTIDALLPLVARAYAEIAPTNNLANAVYKSAVDTSDRSREGLRQALYDLMQQRRGEEIQRGISLVGPHRDDIVLSLGELPAKGYASHGESWSFALALKLGSFQLLRADGIEPVLVLDDVFAELDSTRRTRLAAGVADAEQVLVTAAVPADIPDVLTGARFTVAAGTVEPAGEAQGVSVEPAGEAQEGTVEPARETGRTAAEAVGEPGAVGEEWVTAGDREVTDE